MEAVLGESLLRCGTKPEVIIDSFGHLGILLLADIGSRTADPGPRAGNLANLAGADEFRRAGEAGTAAALRAELHDPVVLACSLDHASTFDEIVRGRLFDVHMLAG